MIFKILKLIIFILLIWYLSEFFANSEGETSINWMGWGIQIPTDRFVLILILFSILIIFIDRIWLAFLNFPKAAFRRYEVNNNKKVEQKLVKAFLLASHGEFESAAKEASLVAKNTKDKNLGKLLSTHLDVFKNLNENSTNKKEISKKSKAFGQNDTKFVDKAIDFLKMLEKEGIPAGQISQVDFVTNRVPKFFVGNPQKSPSFSKFTPRVLKIKI